MDNIVYRLASGRLWSAQAASFISAAELSSMQPDVRLIDLRDAGGESEESSLIRTLEFYDYPLGELVMASPKGIREKLAALDREYLTPRTLADISQNDAIALGRYGEHEEKARPLRERLAILEGRAEQSQGMGGDNVQDNGVDA